MKLPNHKEVLYATGSKASQSRQINSFFTRQERHDISYLCKNCFNNLSLLGAASFKTITAMKKHLQQQVFFQLYSPFGELYYYTEIFASRVCE